MALIAKAEVPAEDAYLDAELASRLKPNLGSLVS